MNEISVNLLLVNNSKKSQRKKSLFINKISCKKTDTIEDFIINATKNRKLQLDEYGLFLKSTPYDNHGIWLMDWNARMESLALRPDSVIECVKKLSTQRILTMDGREHYLMLDETKTVWENLMIITEKFEIEEEFRDGFSLRNAKYDNDWFDENLTLREQGFSGDIILDKKYFINDYKLTKEAPKAIALTYIKAKTRFINGYLKCNYHDALQLACLILRVEKGSSTTSLETIKIERILPNEYQQIPNVEKDIREEWSKTPTFETDIEAQLKFILLCCNQGLYTTILYPITTSSNSNVWLGVDQFGLRLIDQTTKEEVEFIPFKEITNWVGTASQLMIITNEDILRFETKWGKCIESFITKYHKNIPSSSTLDTIFPSFDDLMSNDKLVKEAMEGIRKMERSLYTDAGSLLLKLTDDKNSVQSERQKILEKLKHLEKSFEENQNKKKVEKDRLDACRKNTYDSTVLDLEVYMMQHFPQVEEVNKVISKMWEYENIIAAKHVRVREKMKIISESGQRLEKQKEEFLELLQSCYKEAIESYEEAQREKGKSLFSFIKMRKSEDNSHYRYSLKPPPKNEKKDKLRKSTPIPAQMEVTKEITKTISAQEKKAKMDRDAELLKQQAALEKLRVEAQKAERKKREGIIISRSVLLETEKQEKLKEEKQKEEKQKEEKKPIKSEEIRKKYHQTILQRKATLFEKMEQQPKIEEKEKIEPRRKVYFLASVLYDFSGVHENELSVSAGCVVQVLNEQPTDGWFECKFKGKTGYVPSSHLRIMK